MRTSLVLLLVTPLLPVAASRPVAAGGPDQPGQRASVVTGWSALKLWYRRPAAEWNEALPVGNGRLGAMVFGNPAEERIQLNEETLWTGGPYDPSRSGGAGALPEIRRLLFAGEYAKAHDLFGRTMMGIPYEQMKYQPLGNLWLSFPEHTEFTQYRRELDLDQAIVRVTYRVGDVTFTREVFSSPIDQVIVIRLTADRPGAISFSATLHGVRNVAHSNYDTGYFRMDGVPPDELLLVGKNSDYLGIAGRLTYQARVKALVEGGDTAIDYRTLVVTNADAATLLVAAATSFVNFRDVSADPSARVAADLAAVIDKPYQRIRADHVAEHRRLFRRVALDLGTSAAADLPTDERIAAFEAGADPQLAALYYQFGRYLLISSSRPGTEPANLQGIWNENPNPSWDSKYTININLPMNYWPADVGNLSETFDPLVKLVKDVADAGRAVAREHWGARGWVLHQNTDLWRATAPMDGPSWGAWPVGGAWLCTQLWDHYLFNGDEEYLRDIYPIMKGSVRFLLDILIEHPQYGWLVTAPSNSPENFPAWEGNGRFFDEVSALFLKARTIGVGPTMDMQIIRALFDAYAAAAELLGIDQALRDEVRAKGRRLAPLQIGKHGQLQEWLEDWEEIEPQHRHLSHLWGLFPGTEISPEGTPEYAEASATSIVRRGTGGCGWSMGWKMALWARLLNGSRAQEQFETLIGDNTLPNLFSLCGRTLQVDGNFGATAGIAEMLLQSQAGRIHFLPALPDAWPVGSVQGFHARGGFEVDFSWEVGKFRAASILSRNGNTVRIRTDEPLIISNEEGQIIPTVFAGGVMEFDTQAGSTYSISRG